MAVRGGVVFGNDMGVSFRFHLVVGIDDIALGRILQMRLFPVRHIALPLEGPFPSGKRQLTAEADAAGNATQKIKTDIAPVISIDPVLAGFGIPGRFS